MPDYKGMDKSQYSNDRYMKMMKGKSAKVMKNHGNTSAISADAQKYDMARLQPRKMEYKGHPDKAFEYKY